MAVSERWLYMCPTADRSLVKVGLDTDREPDRHLCHEGATKTADVIRIRMIHAREGCRRYLFEESVAAGLANFAQAAGEPSLSRDELDRNRWIEYDDVWLDHCNDAAVPRCDDAGSGGNRSSGT